MIAIPLLVFAAVLAAVLGGYLLLGARDNGGRELKERLALLEIRGIDQSDIPDVLKKELLSDLPFFQRALSYLDIAQRTDTRLRQAGLEMKVGVFALLTLSLAVLAPKLTSPAEGVKRKVMEFIAARYLNLRVSQGVPADLVEAVLAAGLTDVVDLRAKLDALVAFRADAAFEPLAEVFKRHGIL